MANSVKLVPRELKEKGFPEARFLSSEEQSRYDEEIKKYGDRARNSLNVKSNLFKVLKLNELGIITATFPQLECALENGLDLKGTYEDAPSVVLRSAGDSHAPNNYIAEYLAKKLKIKSFKTPYIINGLGMTEDNNSAYGLTFNTKDAQIIKAPDFDHKNHERKFSRINPDYTIEFDNNATRTLYTRDKGVSRLVLYGGLDLVSWCGDLAGSGDPGRVVVVSGEATSQKILDSYTANFKNKSEEQIAQIKERAKKAENYLRTGKL